MGKIVIDIDKITNLSDIEKFFTLLYEAGVLFHPFMPFMTCVKFDEIKNKHVPLFSDEESDRLDHLFGKCCKVADLAEIDIFDLNDRVHESYLKKLEGRNNR